MATIIKVLDKAVLVKSDDQLVLKYLDANYGGITKIEKNFYCIPFVSQKIAKDRAKLIRKYERKSTSQFTIVVEGDTVTVTTFNKGIAYALTNVFLTQWAKNEMSYEIKISFTSVDFAIRESEIIHQIAERVLTTQISRAS